MMVQSSLATDSSDPSGSSDFVPENLVKECIPKNLSTAVSSSKLFASTADQKLSNELKTFNWDRAEDLVATINGPCLVLNNFTDPILKYVPLNNINLKAEKFVYLILKDSVTDLAQFNADAINSECLDAADINKKITIDTLDPRLTDQSFYKSIGLNKNLMDTILSYNGGNLYSVKVAVIDTGVDITNPDLINQIARDKTSQVIGTNTTNGSTDVSDSGFHGTHVAGLVGAAYDNGILGSGAYGKNIKIFPVRASNDGLTLNILDVSNGVIWAANQGVDLINISSGGPTNSIVYKNALQAAVEKGVFVVVAAGNDGKILSDEVNTYPAMFSKDILGMITVGSYDAVSMGVSSFSNKSPTYVDIMAPGSNGTLGILSTAPMSRSSSGFANATSTTTNGVTRTSLIQGTSMAAPIVTGALAAMISTAKSKGFRISPEQLKRFVIGEGSTKNPAFTSYSSQGNVLNYQAMYSALINQIDSTQKIIELQNQPLSQQVVAGEKVVLSTTLTKNSNFIVNYQWYKNNQIMLGQTKNSLTLTKTNLSDAAYYQIEISSGAKKTLSQKVKVAVGLKFCD